jgi:seryl-tRNA synthetase
MLDLKFIRDNPDVVRQAVANRHDTAPIDEILKLDAERHQKIAGLEELRRTRKAAAKERKMDEAAIESGRDLRDKVKTLEDTVAALDKQLEDLLLRVPNIPQASVPIGHSEDENLTGKTWGEPKKFDFKPIPHWKLGEDLGIIDFERGIKLSGSRFYILNGLGAKLERSLITFMLDLHTNEHGYKEVYLPYMVKRECLYGSGNLPKFADNIYHDAEEDYWFIPTAEVPLTNLHRDEILAPGVLPLNYVAYTACFRREKMSAGKDVRGIKRLHQFDKVEMYKFTEPATSNDELDKMVANAEAVCQKLGLAYRISMLCTKELGFGSSKSFDIEVWAPGIEEWLEVSSCSNCLDFQARRANIRYRPTLEAKPQYVHTLNGSGLALPRIVIALLENYQQADGSVSVPEVLQPYLGRRVITKD